MNALISSLSPVMYLGDDMTLGTLSNAKSERYLIAIGVSNTNAVLTLLNFLFVWPAFGVRHCGMDADIRSPLAATRHVPSMGVPLGAVPR